MSIAGALLLVLFLTACAVAPQLGTGPYQVQADKLVDQYNAAHGTLVPYPIVRDGTLPNLDEGNCHFTPGYTSWITISSAWIAQRHGDTYAMTNTLPHEVAHHICFWLGLADPKQPHGPAWQKVALELGVPADDPFFTDPTFADSNA